MSMSDYYDQKQFLAQVDKEDNILGKIEKWEAHEKAILHRAYTVCLSYQGKLILQHRRHPVFDGVMDLGCSSHPFYINDSELEDVATSAYTSLTREWNIERKDLIGDLVDKGSVYYQADDALSMYREHEVCHLVIGEVAVLPQPNTEYAYGFTLIEKSKLDQEKFPINKAFAPWVPPLLGLLQQ